MSDNVTRLAAASSSMADADFEAAILQELQFLRARDEAHRRYAEERAETAEHLRGELLTMSGLAALKPTAPLIDGLIYRGTLAQIAGGPGSYKSFAAIGMSCALAVGDNFEGHRVPEARNVIYIAGEGATGLQARIAAWCELSGRTLADLEGRLYVLPVPAQLQGEHVQQITELAAEVEAGLIVIDTRARSTTGLDENSATDQGKAIAAADAIIGATGATILAVHHSSRAGSAGRGSNAWDGAVWSDLRMQGSALSARIRCEKHKDAPSGCEHEYRLVPHTVSPALMPDVPEDNRRTLVFVACDTNQADFRGSCDTNESHTFVARTIREHCPPEGLTATMVVEFCKEKVDRSTVYRALKVLVNADVLYAVGSGTKGSPTRYFPAIDSG